MQLSGNTLDRFFDDGEFVLYRAHRKQLELPSVLLLAPASTRPSPAGCDCRKVRSAKPRNEAPLDCSSPEASLESILYTEELQRRPSRPPDYEKENRALVALMAALADSP